MTSIKRQNETATGTRRQLVGNKLSRQFLEAGGGSVSRNKWQMVPSAAERPRGMRKEQRPLACSLRTGQPERSVEAGGAGFQGVNEWGDGRKVQVTRLLFQEVKRQKERRWGERWLEEGVSLSDLLIKMGMISTGLKAEQKGPAEKEKEEREDVREEEEDCRGPAPGAGGYYIKNINQQVSTGSLERRGKETRGRWKYAEIIMARKDVEEALVMGSWGLCWKTGERGRHLLWFEWDMNSWKVPLATNCTFTLQAFTEGLPGTKNCAFTHGHKWSQQAFITIGKYSG